MADIRQQTMRLVDQNQAQALRQENSLIREVHGAYENARHDLLGRFTELFNSLGDEPSPAQIRQLATDANLIRAIEQRVNGLRAELGDTLRSGLTDVSQAGFEAAVREVAILADALGINLIQFAIDPNLELTIGPALEQVPGMAEVLRSNILATLREALASGDRFKVIVDQVFGKNKGPFPRGRTSAELLIRRAVIQANNNARMLYYEQAKGQIPGLKKQAVASIQGDTTETCLKVHGQIRELDEPFETAGREAFSFRQMQPPFHWNCRTSVVAYHPLFEKTSALTTGDMVAAAQKELGNR